MSDCDDCIPSGTPPTINVTGEPAELPSFEDDLLDSCDSGIIGGNGLWDDNELPMLFTGLSNRYYSGQVLIAREKSNDGTSFTGRYGYLFVSTWSYNEGTPLLYALGFSVGVSSSPFVDDEETGPLCIQPYQGSITVQNGKLCFTNADLADTGAVDIFDMMMIDPDLVGESNQCMVRPASDQLGVLSRIDYSGVKGLFWNNLSSITSAALVSHLLYLRSDGKLGTFVGGDDAGAVFWSPGTGFEVQAEPAAPRKLVEKVFQSSAPANIIWYPWTKAEHDTYIMASIMNKVDDADTNIAQLGIVWNPTSASSSGARRIIGGENRSKAYAAVTATIPAGCWYQVLNYQNGNCQLDTGRLIIQEFK